MSGFEIKGWCPGALRPMLSGDGWLVRIRPRGGRLTVGQASGIARASLHHGNGTIDLSARANLQLRGVRTGAHEALVVDMQHLGLIDESPEAEAARNIVVSPFDKTGAGGVADLLGARLATASPLPGKFGFAVDIGPNPVLTTTSADIRLERDAGGGLILRPDGHPLGKPVTPHTAVSEALDLAEWFRVSGGVTGGRGRMAAHLAKGAVLPPGFDRAPAPSLPSPRPGPLDQDWLVGFAFGQIPAETLAALAATRRAVRVTPWRMLILEGPGKVPDLPGVITSPDDPLLDVTACTGAPGCPQALGETRALARDLATRLPRGVQLHVSGCAKGCAHPSPADLTLTATGKGYDLIRNGTAADMPSLTGLDARAIQDNLKALHAPHL
ncbi:MAG: precorrin-3B synthase [Rhodobacterales bacterium]|nr:precorrin-3B synthase [Rhodobacterales bacterium]